MICVHTWRGWAFFFSTQVLAATNLKPVVSRGVQCNKIKNRSVSPERAPVVGVSNANKIKTSSVSPERAPVVGVSNRLSEGVFP